MNQDSKNRSVNMVAPRRPHFPNIPGYRFIQPIAVSPHAAVYLANSTELNQDVAVKVLRTPENKDTRREQIQRFERERELLMRIKHRSVVDIYDWGHTDDFHFIVTEYFPAGSLELRIRNLMSVRDSVDMFLQIAGALVAVHRAGLCHRDLKPANVMLRTDGTVVIIDFGLATTVDSSHLTKAGEVHGSPYYISPEQVTGASNGDNRSDLYSLGVIFYEMLTGVRPFQGKTIYEIVLAHKNQPIPQFQGDLARFQPLLNSMLEKDPNKRMQTAAEALSALSKYKV